MGDKLHAQLDLRPERVAIVEQWILSNRGAAVAVFDLAVAAAADHFADRRRDKV